MHRRHESRVPLGRPMLPDSTLPQSTAVRTVTRLRDAVQRAVATSRSASVVERLTESLRAHDDGSVVARGAKTLGRWTRASALSRWLTTEPEPRQVVIDLRESVFVGPVVATASPLYRRLDSALHHSRVTASPVSTGCRRVVASVSLVLFVALLTESVLSLAAGSLQRTALGLRLLGLALTLAGTRAT